MNTYNSDIFRVFPPCWLLIGPCEPIATLALLRGNQAGLGARKLKSGMLVKRDDEAIRELLHM